MSFFFHVKTKVKKKMSTLNDNLNSLVTPHNSITDKALELDKDAETNVSKQTKMKNKMREQQVSLIFSKENALWRDYWEAISWLLSPDCRESLSR